MSTEQKSIPRWILIVSGLISLLELMVSISLLVSPEAVLESVDLSAKGVDYVVSMWATRQFALGFIFGFATLKKSSSMLTLAYIFFLVMMIGDLFIGIVQRESALIITAIVMCGITSVLIYAINKKR